MPLGTPIDYRRYALLYRGGEVPALGQIGSNRLRPQAPQGQFGRMSVRYQFLLDRF